MRPGAASVASAAQVRRAPPRFLLRRIAGAQGHQSDARRPAHHRADRPLGLRQVDAAAGVQPHVRALSGPPRRRARCGSTARISSPPRWTWRSCASVSAWCSRSRRRFRCRSSTTSPSGCDCRGAFRERELAERVEEALRGAAMWEEVKDKLHEDGRSLSGGQQQRLCIARTHRGAPEVHPVR